MTSCSELLEAAKPSSTKPMRKLDDAWTDVETKYSLIRSRRRHRSVIATGLITLASATALIIGLIPSSLSTPATASAATFLRNAAEDIKHEQLIPSDLLQYQYIVSTQKNSSGNESKNWTSTDGTQPGVMEILETTDGITSVTTSTSSPVCTPPMTGGCFDIGSFPDMPTNVGDLVSYFVQKGILNPSVMAAGSDPTKWNPGMWGQTLPWLLSNTYLTPDQQAEMFTMLSEESGMTLVPQVQDAIGRTGVGILYQRPGPAGVGVDSEEFIFDPTTYAFLGMNVLRDGIAPYSWAALPLTGSNSLPEG